jgi:hypothetical protein
MPQDMHRRLPLILVIVQVILAFLVLSGVREMSFIFYAALILSLLVSFAFYILLVTIPSTKSNLEEQQRVVTKKESVITKKEEKTISVNDTSSLTKHFEELRTKNNNPREAFLHLLADRFQMVQGVFFKEETENQYEATDLYAWCRDETPASFYAGETLSGQVVVNKKLLYLTQVPENYITVFSGLGSSTPSYLLIVPFINGERVEAVVEAAFFRPLEQMDIDTIAKLSDEFSRTGQLFN